MSEAKLKAQAKEIEEVKGELEDKQQTRDKLQGKLETFLTRLEKEFDLSSLKDAHKELVVIKKEASEGKTKINQMREEITTLVEEMDNDS